jgi:hypothetical protein
METKKERNKEGGTRETNIQRNKETKIGRKIGSNKER